MEATDSNVKSSGTENSRYAVCVDPPGCKVGFTRFCKRTGMKSRSGSAHNLAFQIARGDEILDSGGVDFLKRDGREKAVG